MISNEFAIQSNLKKAGSVQSKDLQVRVFTHGSDIYFNKGEYSTISTENKNLLMHELTHIMQQRETDTNLVSHKMNSTLKRFFQSRSESQIQCAKVNFLGNISINTGISLISQGTKVSCWAAALAIIVNTKDSRSICPIAMAQATGMDLNNGYSWSDIRFAVSMWNLTELPPRSAEPRYWTGLLPTHRLFWVVDVGAPYYAVVVGAMHGTGSSDATEVYKPWPPNSGMVEYKTFMDFTNEFELGAGAMIVHR